MNLIQNRIYKTTNSATKTNNLVKNKFGNYSDATNYFAIPYQHHTNRFVWNVCVGIDARVEHIMAIAEDAIEASAHALQVFKDKLQWEMEQEEKEEEG